MTAYAAKRVLSVVPVLVGITAFVFLMLHLVPGDPVILLLGEGGVASPQAMNALRHELGLTDPLPLQFVRYTRDVSRGNWGRSIRFNRPVLALLIENGRYTIELAAAALTIAVVAGLPLGILAAVQRTRWGDSAAMFVSLVGVSMPSFWLGAMLIFAFSLHFKWFPAIGQGGLNRLVLPGIALAFAPMASLARLVRSSLLEILGEDYVRTARAKGMAERAVILRHALRNALIPVVTFFGLETGRLLGGAFVVETVFSRIGLGRTIVNAILNKDFPVVQGAVLFVAVLYVAVNLVVDLSYAVLDPRVRFE
ncbi:MAG TPA: ABC transporter permease [bacterium]|nr:ABC transporter permease [bacterium]